MPFKTLHLSAKMLKTIETLGYSEPTEIQSKAIPLLLKRKDLLATSQTGTGKTAAFILPMLENLKEESNNKTGDERYKIKALILAPTRELVLQIHDKIETYGEAFTHTSVALYGGVKLGSQIKEIRSGANIAVATTARLLDHVKNGTINLSEVEMVIVDEADKMLEMGFIDEIRQIMNLLPKKVGNTPQHTVMFSATFPKPIMKLANSFLNHPSIIEIEKNDLTTKQVEQHVHHVNEEQKINLLSTLIRTNQWEQILTFTNTKLQADKIVEHLKAHKISALAIHGDKTQTMRLDALKQFKEKNIQVLVSTDVAARGIDINHLPCVINFELPINNEDYVHRIGRTGRAQQKGEALSLICQKELEQLSNIESMINKKLSILHTDGFECTHTIKGVKQKIKKEKNKKTETLKKAKELAEKMMGKDNLSKKSNKKNKNSSKKSPSNKRHF